MTGETGAVSGRREKRQAEEFARLLEESELRIVQARLEREQFENNGSEGSIGETEAVTPGAEGQANERTELTVDLPQGQKLTLKGIEPGTIVEVASWSGKSGPHDGAIRMLFGASGQEGEEEGEEQEEEEEEEQEEETLLDPDRTGGADHASGSLDVVSAEGLTDATGVDDVLHPRESALYSSTRKRNSTSRSEKRRNLVKRISIFIGGLLLLVGAVFGLRAADILYFVSPDSGLTTGLGGAETSIAAVNPRAGISPDSTVIAEIDGRLVMVGVAQVGGDELLVFTGASRLVVPKEDVVGRVLFVIPFLGYLSGEG